MDHLLRSHAPLTDEAWSRIDDEARERLAPALAGRKLVDFSGPLGWQHSGTDVGRATPISAPSPGLAARRRVVLPLVELRAPFALSIGELEDAARGALDVDLGTLDAAAKSIAHAENAALFHGWADAEIRGIADASPHEKLTLGPDVRDCPGRIASAVASLLSAGVNGPFGLALGPDGYTGVVETTEHGRPVADHLREILGGPIVRAPGVNGAVVVSLRGGDFLFESGEDLSVGYTHHDAELVHLYLEESFSFRIVSPDAAIALTT
ncbi:MAG TPA: family 1 encapsulin nanocompartment shell protein [Acidimicrobiales bacterium]|nr:family 1 encapsulin nanocompartment shell protein [Acidimicrobiales bacterium]